MLVQLCQQRHLFLGFKSGIPDSLANDVEVLLFHVAGIV
jgi:hypothetical protein